MKKTFIIVLVFMISKISFTQTTSLKGVTFGVGVGWSRLGKTPKEYFLTTDINHKLQVQELSKSSIVISSLITIKLGDLSLQNQTNGSVSKTKLVSSNRTVAPTVGLFGVKSPGASKGWKVNGYLDPTGAVIKPVITNESPKFVERLAINVGLNLAEINDGDILFNKTIDGGIGIGCFLTEFVQVGLFYDMIRMRQLRDYVVNNYLNNSIPNGNDTNTALDEKDNNLFYSKYFSGISIKIVFSLGNK